MSTTPTLSQQTQFVIQGVNQLTIPQGQTPVIAFDITGMKSNTVFTVASAVNFLRCGCRSVQLMGSGRKEQWADEKQWIKDHFAALQLPHELFHVNADDENFVLLYASDRSTHD